MNTQANPNPAWRPYADQVVKKLLAHRRHRALVANPLAALSDSDSDNKVEPYDLSGPDLPDPSPATASEAAAEASPESGPAAAQPSRAVSDLSPRVLSLAIRLAATLESAGAMRVACGPGAITVIHGLTLDELDPARRIVTEAFLPQGVLVHDDLRHRRRETDGSALILLAPEIRTGASDRHARRRFGEALAEALNDHLPLLLLLPDPGMPPEVLQEATGQGEAQLLRLAPLSREILVAHLSYSHHLDAAHEPEIRAALPPDRLLASLCSTALLLALRASEPCAVAARLARLATPAETSGPHLEAMAGNSLALTAARRLVADLQSWQAGWIKWNELSRSLLLYGPPGTGKTHLARAMGNSAGIAMVTGSFAEWQAAGHLGDMLQAMRTAFAEARRQAPSMLFIDEIDAIGSREGGDQHGGSYRRQVINGFLAEMDSIAREEGVIVVAACNDPTVIDPAVLRPGRFDLRILVPLPDVSTIQGMLMHHLGTLFNEDELISLSTACTGQSVAAIDAAIRAARVKARHGGAALTGNAIRRQLGITDGPAKDALDHRIALHECGHALVAAALDRGQPTRVLITPEGGETHRRNGPDHGCLADHLAELTVFLAGRAAERLILGEASSGAGGAGHSDLARATSLALEIETQSGLGLSGPVWTDTPAAIALRDPAIHRHVRQRLDAAEAQATAILMGHRALLQRMAADLQRDRELAGAALASWLAQVTPTWSGMDDAAGEVIAAPDRSRSASADGPHAADPDGRQGVSEQRRQPASRQASTSEISQGQRAHPDQDGDPHHKQDAPEIGERTHDPDQAI